MVFKIIYRFIKYYISAKNGKGHGIHSPFVYEFVRDILLNKHQSTIFDTIESYRAELKFDNSIIEIGDLGAKSKTNNKVSKKTSDIAKHSLTKEKYAKVLHHIVKKYSPNVILELGTSLGITTSYIATASTNAQIHTVEGCPNIANIAQKTFEKMNLSNVKLHISPFQKILSPLLQELKHIDLVFIDGNHTYEATIFHFNTLLQYINHRSIIIFDDIYWSDGMTKAWEEIKQHQQVSLTIDIFQFGLVFFNKDILKQDYVIRF